MTTLNIFTEQYFKRRQSKRTLACEFSYLASNFFTSSELSTLSNEPLWRATASLISILDRTDAPKNVAYHNKLHFADAMSAAVLLSMYEPGLTAHDRMALLAIMTAHDVYHDGTVNTIDKCLEQVSASAFTSVMQNNGVPKSQIDTVVEVILSTDPRLNSQNHVRYSSSKNTVDILVGLAHDADLLGSWLPASGMENGKALALEWSSIEQLRSSNVGTFQARTHFLKAVKPITRASQALNVHGVCDTQIILLQTSHDDITNGSRDMAAYLDSLPHEEASSEYLSMTEHLLENASLSSLLGSPQ